MWESVRIDPGPELSHHSKLKLIKLSYCLCLWKVSVHCPSWAQHTGGSLDCNGWLTCLSDRTLGQNEVLGWRTTLLSSELIRKHSVKQDSRRPWDIRGARTIVMAGIRIGVRNFPSKYLVPMGTTLASPSLAFGPVRSCKCQRQANQDDCCDPS